jgi:hypothetical protein
MFNNKKKYALILSNNLTECIEDIKRLSLILKNYEFDLIKPVVNCYPKVEILNFLNEIKIKEDDLLYIHYSGHCEKRGIKVGDKCHVLSCWMNPNRTIVSSYEIDNLLSTINCKIILSSDCCYTETFGDYFSNSSFTFIGTSTINNYSISYSINNKPMAGALVCLYEDIISNNKELNIENLKNYKSFFKKNNIKQKLIIKQK